MEGKWMAIEGKASCKNNEIAFSGGYSYENGNSSACIGKYSKVLSNIRFIEGTIKFKVQISKPTDEAKKLIDDKKLNNFFGLTFNYEEFGNEERMGYIGITDHYRMFELKEWNGKWDFWHLSGSGENLEYDYPYEVEIRVEGSVINMKIDDVLIINKNLPNMLNSYLGFLFSGSSDMLVKDVEVLGKKAESFVVMQFSEEFNVLYQDVIKPVCERYNLSVVRADDIYTSNMIISDIVTKINKSKIVIADITPNNRNVYYEVGYAHAIGKPTILLAEKGTDLPFDLSPFRVIFYENTIKGKDIVLKNLENHIKVLLG